MPRVLPSSKVRKWKVTIPGSIGVCSYVFQTRQRDGIAARLVQPYNCTTRAMRGQHPSRGRVRAGTVTAQRCHGKRGIWETAA